MFSLLLRCCSSNASLLLPYCIFILLRRAPLACPNAILLPLKFACCFLQSGLPPIPGRNSNDQSLAKGVHNNIHEEIFRNAAFCYAAPIYTVTVGLDGR